MLKIETCLRCGNEYKTTSDDYTYECCKCSSEISDKFTQIIQSSNDQLTDVICEVLKFRDGCPEREMSCSKCLKLALEKLLELQ